MAQLHLYVPDRMAEELRQKARAKGLSVSRYLARLVRRELGTGWPKDFFKKVVGGWKGEPLERPSQGELENREGM